MLTMRAAAQLLSSCRSLDALADLIVSAGLSDRPMPIDARAAERLGVATAMRLGGGIGEIRVLLAETDDAAASRDGIQRVVRRLASRAPHVLWIAALAGRSGRCAIVGWTRGEHGPRISAFVWDPDHVVDADAETLCALADVGASDDVRRHARYVEVLGRDALTRRFYRELRAEVESLAAAVPAPSPDAMTVAVLYVSRLLFLCFLEAKGWLNGERAFIASRFDECMRQRGGFHQRVLLPLFFGTLNTPPSRRATAARALGAIPFLNGGLFARTPLERRVGSFRFDDERLGALLARVFQRYRFVAREDSATWSEASIDPEMLGRSFESLMASGERRSTGAYYTPHELVARVADHALAEPTRGATLGALREIRVLDPACGSGAFLVHTLERLADLRRGHGDTDAIAAIRRDVLARSIFGVDLSPTAVWLCELRLWLCVVIDSDERDPMRVPPLPNLDRNIRVGDALTGAAFDDDLTLVAGSGRARDVRRRYIRATGARKKTLARALDREERRRVLARIDRDIDRARHERRELLSAARTRDLFGERPRPSAERTRTLKQLRDALRALRGERRRLADGGALPFSFDASFPDVQARGGFDVVVGNPPWVRLHRIPRALRLQFRRTYEVFREVPSMAGATTARVSRGFASQVDLAALFAERAVRLSRPGGTISLLMPAKLWRSLAGAGLRRFLTEHARLLRLEDCSRMPHAFDAAVYPSIIVVTAGRDQRPVDVAVREAWDRHAWRVAPARLPLDALPGSPWVLLRPDTRQAFDRLRDGTTPLAASGFGPPRLGVKSGCNAAFVVRVTDVARDIACVVDADGERGSIEAALLRPALRGESVVPWWRGEAAEWIVWTHDATGAPLARLPERARAWLRRRYTDLVARTDAARTRRWWSLFRVDAADSRRSRVVWADIGKRPRALVLPAGDPVVPLNSCYVVACDEEKDATALCALLNGPLAAAWLNALAEPARGGYRRYLGWTVGQLPLPSDWERARDILVAAARGTDGQLLDAALDAYRVRRAHVQPLLDEAS